jgi:hypothetical protein
MEAAAKAAACRIFLANFMVCGGGEFDLNDALHGRARRSGAVGKPLSSMEKSSCHHKFTIVREKRQSRHAIDA